MRARTITLAYKHCDRNLVDARKGNEICDLRFLIFVIIVLSPLLESILVGILPPVSLRLHRDWLTGRTPGIGACLTSALSTNFIIDGVVIGPIERINANVRQLINGFIIPLLPTKFWRECARCQSDESIETIGKDLLFSVGKSIEHLYGSL